MIYFLLGLFCFLLVIGAMMGKKPMEFALKSGVVLAAVVFVGYVLLNIH